MKLLFFADLHLGAGDRLDDQIAVIDRIAKIAHERDVDTVLFGGDATHRRVATPSELAAFQRLLHDLEQWEIPFLGINGNHDVTTMDAPSTLEVAAEGFKHAMALSRPDTMPVYRSFLSSTSLGVVACLPWCPTSAIAAMDPTGQVDDVARTAEETLLSIARGLYAEAVDFDPGKPVVLLLHWSMSGAVTPTGALVDEFREVVLPSAELAEMGFAAVLGGHIHSAGMVGQHAVPVLYAGSPAVVDWGESEVAHGVWIIDTDPQVRCEFVPVADRKFVTVGLDAPTGLLIFDDPDDAHGAYVRVRYEATAEQERSIDHEAIKRTLCEYHGAHKVTGIHPTITTGASTRAAVTEEVDVDEALALWLEGQSETFDPGVVGVHASIKEAVR